MISHRKSRALGGAGAAAVLAALAVSPAAYAQQATTQFSLPEQPLAQGLLEFGRQARISVAAPRELVAGKNGPPLQGEYATSEALNRLLAGTGLEAQFVGPDAVRIVQAGGGSGPQGESAGADVEALIVTAQKREENIQDVPIAISAFSAKALDEQKLEGGYDLLKAIPNVTFSKSNYSGYNFSIRGVGTKAVSATSDPGVAVSFNNVSLIRNRLFEQEYLDIERVEVLRGPQGTLYGRNATSGVINVVTAKPDLSAFEGRIKGEVGSYEARRLSAFVNLPLVEDVLGVRVAGALTERDGYSTNLETGNSVDGRDLWSGRVSLAFEPIDSLRADLVWERFEEDDDRLRTGKQLCHRDPGPGDLPGMPALTPLFVGRLSQGCKIGSLYDDAAFEGPNGLSIPFIVAAQYATNLGTSPIDGEYVPLLQRGVDPFDVPQSRDLRAMASIFDPEYRAKADIFSLTVGWDVTGTLSLVSQTLYNEDYVYSFQDYHRFATLATFNDSMGIHTPNPPWVGPNPYADVVPNGVFTDPQIGPSNRLAGMEISSSDSSQFAQEFRLQSDFDGAFNFAVGANYTRFKGLNDYFLFYNVVTAIAQIQYNRSADLVSCNNGTFCVHIDPTPLNNLAGDGHNYFRNRNPYKLESKAIFGETYWQASDVLKVTAGLRFTDDRKSFTPWRSQLMVAGDDYGPANPINQRWTAVTGRLGIDWKPELALTEETLVYAFYSRGYKGGGANPPPSAPLSLFGIPFSQAPHHQTFRPEYVDALEFGTKNTLLGGALVLNGSAFFYDYKDYQVSKVVDRTVVNENFDAKIWGLELEGVWRPTRELRVNATLGLLDTKIGKGERSIDIFDRTQGREGWIVVTPWLQQTSNCIVPIEVMAELALYPVNPGGEHFNPFIMACTGYGTPPFTSFGDFDPADYPEINNGAGFYDELSGNELPNAPHWTFNIGAQYTMQFAEGWEATVRGDYYRQGQSFARVYNRLNDKLRGWDNANLTLRVERPDDALAFELYAKNIFDETPITDAFLNSDSTGMTTNVFTLDPRLIGFSVTKGF